MANLGALKRRVCQLDLLKRIEDSGKGSIGAAGSRGTLRCLHSTTTTAASMQISLAATVIYYSLQRSLLGLLLWLLCFFSLFRAVC